MHEQPRIENDKSQLGSLSAHIEHVKGMLAAYGNNDSEFSDLARIFARCEKGEITIEKGIELANAVFDNKNLR